MPVLSKDHIYSIYLGIKCLVVFRDVTKYDALFKKFTALLEIILKKDSSVEELLDSYSSFVNRLFKIKEEALDRDSGDIWQNHILNTILSDENIFSLKAESGKIGSLESPLVNNFKNDLLLLQQIYKDFSLPNIEKAVKEKISKILLDSDSDNVIKNQISAFLPSIDRVIPESENRFLNFYLEESNNIKRVLASSSDWRNNVEALVDFYRNVGCGKLGRFLAFKWVRRQKGGYLAGIPNPDPIRLENLIGYEEQRTEVVRNTQQFVKGYPANNMLLYGDRGTGKSSTIKALIHKFGVSGLRLIQVSKDSLADLPDILEVIRERPYRFIIFIDDLSFEEYETEYKYLKAVLEGNLEAKPDNVVIYATSNRRHLVKEFLSDVEKTGEIRAQDTVQEKLSLSDRFGITVIFPTPDQETYLKIVEGLAEQKKLNIEKDKLRKLALQWEIWHNERSGRTAKQFIDDLQGKLGLLY
ncbi:MAG: uncharacterized protein PWR14_664 [Thermosediminibacterales bacterium]|nr:uncharacterized protein [Thermosediminibacterales bacterium]